MVDLKNLESEIWILKLLFQSPAIGNRNAPRESNQTSVIGRSWPPVSLRFVMMRQLTASAYLGGLMSWKWILVLGMLSAGCNSEIGSALTGPSLRATSNGDVQRITDVFTILPNNCNGDLVSLTGDILYVARIVQRPDGSYHVTSNFNLHAKGFALGSGDPYVGKLMGQFTQTVQPGTVNTNVFQMHLIGTGQTQDMNIRQLVHWTVTPDGKFAVFNSDFVVDCP